MTSLLNLILIYPIQKSLIRNLPLADLFNLSKTNSIIRAAFHDFPVDQGRLSPTQSRHLLFIGQHNTLHWKNCKSKSLLLCSEPHHVRGKNVKGCRMCSMPVCEACVIKSSFAQRNDRTFSNRTRSFCPECYNFGNSIKNNALLKTNIKHSPPGFDLEGSTCKCTVKDSHLCVKCKTKQNLDAKRDLNQCRGAGCSSTKDGGFVGRVCLWCGLRLPDERSRATARRDYDLIHILARSHSTYERPSDDDLGDPAEQVAVWDSTLAAHPPPYKAKVRPPDPIEEERQRLLSDVSARRSHTAHGAEEERWRQCESFRRHETFRPPPPTLRQRTTPAADASRWRDTDSITPTLVETDHAELMASPDLSIKGGDSSFQQQQNLAKSDS